MRPILFAAGMLTLGAAWLGPLPDLAASHFSAHMTMHMAVVAVAAPLLSLSVAGRHLDPSGRLPMFLGAVPASMLELAVVWGWHAPALHHYARTSLLGLFSEQGMFLASSLLVWISAFGGDRAAGGRTGAGVLALLLTSTHMTLLGALLALSPRALYLQVHAGAIDPLTALGDQHLGGAIMLLVGGAAYLLGGLLLANRLLHRNPSVQAPERT
jgi:putative membrane protein